tara:strand:+ start:1591 stop:1950 length:360 start_codon:yes stop_codon:yes gene_type:complete
MNNDFNIEFEVNYNTIDDEVLSNTNYQDCFLKFFKIENYDYEKIDPKIEILFKKMNSNKYLKSILEKINSIYNIDNSLQSVIFLFCYDYFHVIFPLFKIIIKNEEIEEKFVNNILNNLI